MALFKGSAYETTRSFDPPEDGGPRFEGLRTRDIAAPEPILEHAVVTGDRLDALGQHYYANPRDWRRLADCNPQALFAEDMVWLRDPPADPQAPAQPLGEVILVPRRREGGA
jgi:nucleoid-associated protein YgaU